MKIYKMKVWVKRLDSDYNMEEIREGSEGFWIKQTDFFKKLNHRNQQAGCTLIDIYENDKSIRDYIGGVNLSELSESEIFQLVDELKEAALVRL